MTTLLPLRSTSLRGSARASWLFAASSLGLVAACSGELTTGRCPAERPADRTSCYAPGTVCEYPRGCRDASYRASCSGDGSWHVDYFPNHCTEPPEGGSGGTAGGGGAAGAGGEAEGGEAGAGGGGGAGGAGGA